MRNASAASWPEHGRKQNCSSHGGPRCQKPWRPGPGRGLPCRHGAPETRQATAPKPPLAPPWGPRRT
eukprot:1817548-Pyramimonas_sp.AAC.1